MDNEIKTWIGDIVRSIEEVESYFNNPPMTLEAYTKDIKTKRAVERGIEIIGEATNRIMHRDPSFYLDNSYKIVGTRNRIAHGYDKVSDEFIYEIVVKHFPLLKAEVEKLLK